ncbi:glycosyltransferase [Draconibacterium sp. IB214405]|uniref:glycosyltransferase n=1 Tax=Draconibacterium sp. IB214405 TaxID=3097352 RepID=UPI002A0C0A21|nr:glycosyltransferase [Draconibacterium sp. IB214405]MDX8338703.1 glycosyltransferase [Draconibacterium sp. IB214405]
MSEAIIITPVKDSLSTTKRTVESVMKADGDFSYFIFNDFSQPETKTYLDEASAQLGFNVIHLEDITDTPSPNYKIVLQRAQEMALKEGIPLIIIESDVVISKDTVQNLLAVMNSEKNPGLVGAITTDEKGDYNFPYNFEKIKNDEIVDTSHSLSFCCTLLTVPFLKQFDFNDLAQNKDWFDVFISRQSKKIGFSNYLAKGIRVMHLPHSSRPWKNLKYTNPVLYYLKKIFLKRDRI